MATFSFEEGINTEFFSTTCALRMRVNMSAIGSLMLILYTSLPARLGDARHVAAHRDFAQLVAPQTELAISAARAAGEFAAVAQPRRIGVARQLLKLQTRLITHLFGLRLIVDDRVQLGALLGEFLHQCFALEFAIDQSEFGQ